MVQYDFVYDKEFYNKEIEGDYFIDKKLGYTQLNHAYILPHKVIDGVDCGGIVTSEHNFVENSSLHAKQGGSYSFDSTTVEESDETVIYLGMFVGIWGHCITDNIRRLWFLKSEYYKQNYENCKLVYVPFADFQFSDNFRQLIQILGCNEEDFIPIFDIKRYKHLILPDESFYTIDGSARYFTNEYINSINIIREYARKLPANETLNYDKVYFTYSKYAGMRQIGEKKLEKYFERHGYQIIAPEEYSLEQQLYMLIHCKQFASTVGSCSHNIIFLEDNTTVILIPRAYYLTGYQVALNYVHPLNISIVDSSMSVMVQSNSPWTGPFYYFVSENLYNYFNENIENRKKYLRSNLKDFKLYLAIGLVIGLYNGEWSDRLPPEFYSKVALNYLQSYCKIRPFYKIIYGCRKCIKIIRSHGGKKK